MQNKLLRKNIQLYYSCQCNINLCDVFENWKCHRICYFICTDHRNLRTLLFFPIPSSSCLLYCVTSRVRVLVPYSFGLISYLAGLRPTLRQLQRGSLTHLILIKVQYLIQPKVTGSRIARLGQKAWSSTSVKFESGTFQFRIEVLSHLATLPS